MLQFRKPMVYFTVMDTMVTTISLRESLHELKVKEQALEAALTTARDLQRDHVVALLERDLQKVRNEVRGCETALFV